MGKVSHGSVLNENYATTRVTFGWKSTVKTLKRDYVQVTPLPDAQTVLGLIGGWIDDYNENHPHSGLKMRSPRDFIAAQTATA